MDEQPKADALPVNLRSPAPQSVPDEIEAPALPPFVAEVGTTPASWLQASFLLGTRVVTFQVPLPSLDAAAVLAAAAKLVAEVREAGATSVR